MKQCSKCGELKPLSEFYKAKTGKDGLRGDCKVCYSKQSKKWQQNNAEKLRKYQREYDRKWRKKNLKKYKKYYKKHYKDNSEKIKEYSKKWIKDNPEKVKEIKRRTHKKLSKIPSYKINRAISNSIRIYLKGNKNGKHWETLVGYTREELMKHLENQFEPWMTWDNYGKYEKGKLKWHIDHIKPKSLFNFTSPEDPELKECWALENLQPLEAMENFIKNNKY